jgi:hypothetical protein
MFCHICESGMRGFGLYQGGGFFVSKKCSNDLGYLNTYNNFMPNKTLEYFKNHIWIHIAFILLAIFNLNTGVLGLVILIIYVTIFYLLIFG